MPSAESPSPILEESTRVFLKAGSGAGMSQSQLSDGGGSLSRRARVRRRNSRRDDDEDSSSDLLSTSGEISSGQLFVKIPPTDVRSASSLKSPGAPEVTPPPRPPRSPRRLQTIPASENTDAGPSQLGVRIQRARSTDSPRRTVLDDNRGRETRSEDSHQGRISRSRGASLPRQVFRTNSSDSSEQPSPLTPKAPNDIPPIPVFAPNRRYRHHPRDSGVTQTSTASSSIYPKSTSTEGSYPRPPSLPAQDVDDVQIITVDAIEDTQFHELHEMDADDVSYRLRLLMKNNYYLPPAHAKPFPEVSTPETPKKSPAKSPSPTFFDFFKTVKKKNVAQPDAKGAGLSHGPVLRTTSDSSTLSGILRPQQPASSTQNRHTTFPEPCQETKGRVVVVRERMDDLESVAKQVEQELKGREAERRRIASETSQSNGPADDFVDPTDSVDLPPDISKDLFGTQAALLRGMGIDSSLGAALLAERLPPSSPAIWSVDSEEATWRRALLHAAVDHSLNNSSAEGPSHSGSDSSHSYAPGLSSPRQTSTTQSIRARSVTSPIYSPHLLPSVPEKDDGESTHSNPASRAQKPIIGQRILNKIIDESPAQSMSQRTSGESSDAQTKRNLKADGQMSDSRVLLVTTEPARASSPAVPTIPLPPPRRANSTPNLSGGSQTNIAPEEEMEVDDSLLENSPGCLRADHEKPLRLSDSYESRVSLSSPFGQHTSPVSSSKPAVAKPRVSLGHVASTSSTSGSHYSGDEDLSVFHTAQENKLAATFVASRISLGEASISRESYESSNRTSIYRDAFDRTPYADSFVNGSTTNTLGEISCSPSRASDQGTLHLVSPPPRVSSRHEASPTSLFFNNNENREVSPQQGEIGTGGALLVPRLSIQGSHPSGTHADSYPTSPISFFDAVEMQSRQEEEEDSDDSDNVDEPGELRDDASVLSSGVAGYHSDSAGMTTLYPRSGSTQSTVVSPQQPYGSITQQRNVSLPQIGSASSSGEHSNNSGFDSLDHRRAITNVPAPPSRTTFWSKKHGKKLKLFPNPPRASESTADQLRHEAAMEAFAGSKRPHTAGSRAGSTSGHSDQEKQDPSLRRLDGMLVEHIEREKEVLKRITATLSKQST